MPGFDALTHLDRPPLVDDLEAVASAARQAGVTDWLVAGWDPEAWSEVRAAASASGGVLALGVHPWVTGREGAGAVEDHVARLAEADPPVVGEIGLDHLRAGSERDRARQRDAFRAQLAWAREQERPVVIHAVRAVPEVLHVLRDDGLGPAGGMIHGWHQGAELAQQALDLGLHLSIGPLLLGRSPHKIEAALQVIPADRLLLETDSPEQSMPDRPAPAPEDLPRLAERVALLLDTDVDDVLDRTGDNARRLFRKP